MKSPRSSKECGCFPYGNKLICYLQIADNGELEQLTTPQEKRNAYFSAVSGEKKLYAVWPGQWHSSDLFIIDDLEAFREGQKLFRF